MPLSLSLPFSQDGERGAEEPADVCLLGSHRGLATNSGPTSKGVRASRPFVVWRRLLLSLYSRLCMAQTVCMNKVRSPSRRRRSYRRWVWRVRNAWCVRGVNGVPLFEFGTLAVQRYSLPHRAPCWLFADGS